MVILGTVAACAPPLVLASGQKAFMAATLLVLAASLVVGYRRARAPVAADVLDAGCFTLVLVFSQVPLVAFGIAFQTILYRGLYTSSRRALLRTVLYLLSFVVGVPLWAQAQPEADPRIFRAALVAGLLSTATVSFFGWQLAVSIAAREASARRERLISRTGQELLGALDEARIRVIGLRAIEALVADTPGLRAVSVRRDDQGVKITSSAGFLARTPERLPPAGDLGSPAFWRPLGEDCHWEPLIYDETPTEAVALGFPGPVPKDVTATAGSILNQVLLAYRNSLAHSELRVQALTDPLTGLVNRTGFTEATGQVLSHPDPGPVSVLFIDLDDFKEVNDNLGHAAGDALLVRVAALLQSLVRTDDVVARLGGDEFAVLLRGIDEDAAARIAERVVLGTSMLTSGPDGEYTIGASIGLVRGEPGAGLEDLLIRADLAMYEAKGRGKGRLQAWRPELRPTTRPR
ncbi:GGDEF domain-containing protein [Kineosporia succinea]|uniref:Diguanylate cyclase (GGDEF)-like protein n=1 Tax=Kineosporia succinea TaxID=84632 RepID=A0ABT9PDQ6_9ACTN|nr:GGDEF domain-containing protein [Kineosporia succinea]MDP9830830.1 diguanylate cyclase (GGDEF)-like protein [Kineosporia succinea]